MNELTCFFTNGPHMTLTHKHLIVELVYFVVFWINTLGDLVSGELRAHTVMNCLTVSYKKHCRLEFCEYVQPNKDHDNSM